MKGIFFYHLSVIFVRVNNHIMKQQMKCTIGLFVLSIFFVQCRKSIYNNPGLNAGTEVTTTLCGLVVDENGVPIDKRLVQCNGKNCMTTNKGISFLIRLLLLKTKQI